METLQLKKVGATPSTFFVAATKNRKTDEFRFQLDESEKRFGRITSIVPPRGTTEG